jgi:drug/metabolite transporter (DMT)-like permease
MSYVAFAWIAVIVYGLETVIIKLSSKYSIKNPWLFNILWNIIFVLFMVPFYASQHISMPKTWESLLVVSTLSAVCSILYIVMIYRLDVSVLSPLYNVKTGLAVFFAWALLGETMTMYQSVLVMIIIVMGFIVSIEEKTTFKSFFRKDIVYAMVFMVVLALYVIFLKKTILDIGFWNTNVWVAGLTLVFLLPTYTKFKKDLKTLTWKQVVPVVLVALTSTIAYVTSNKAYEAHVGITSVIMSFPSSMILAFILAIVWPQLMERHTMKVYAMRFAATAVMFWCAIQLG